MKPIIALIGRTNVGKSTLFNRIISESKAITSPIAGTTRDRNYGETIWQNTELVFVDTGGLDVERKSEIEKNVLRQAERAISEAHFILFVVDLQTGLLPQEREIAKKLKASRKPTLLVGNKADNPALRSRAEDKEWMRLNLGKIIPVSAENGAGVGDLLDSISRKLAAEDKKIQSPFDETPIKVAIIGKPNVGKSSLVNKILGEERVIVSDIPHTTREPQDSLLLYNGRPFTLIDTAGIRKRAKIAPGLEKAGVKKSLAVIHRADAIVLTLDAREGLGTQERHLAGIIEESGKPVVTVVNKWDLVRDKTAKTMDAYRAKIIRDLPFLSWAPILFTSAKTGERVGEILNLARLSKEEAGKMIDEPLLEKFLKKTVREHRPTKAKGVRHPYIYSLKQISSAPPTFMLVIKELAPIHPSYIRFIENRLREKFGFKGTPIKIISKSVKRRE
ncbi:ribosome biogenesis GTPase Der [Candidatus Uhrbacteria bacterium]|nr:ribosome biogenesis GTPase Der [Candidatus Uhrbacteria bacterium]